MFKELWSNIMKPKKRSSRHEDSGEIISMPTESGVRLLHSNGRFIVVDVNDKPLTQWYDEDTFSFTVDAAKSVQRMAKATGRKPDPAIDIIASYSPPAPAT